MDIAALGIKVDSATAVKATGDLDKLTAAGGRADVAVAGVGKASVRAAGGMSAGATNARMMALQISQVAQQSMAGGGFIRALAIQLPDMAVGFGAVGIAAGVLAGVALPLLASMFGSTSSSAEMTATALEGLDAKTKAYTAAAAAATAPTEQLALTYGNLAIQARAALMAMSDVALVEAITATNTAVQTLVGSLLSMQAVRGSGGRAVALALADDFGLAEGAARKLEASIFALRDAQGLEAQARAAAEIQRQLIAAYGSVAKMPAPLQAAYAQMAQITIRASETNATLAKMPGILGMAASAAASVASAVSGIGSAAQGAIAGVSGLVDKMYQLAYANQAANQARQSASKVYSGRGGNPATAGKQGYGFKYDGPALDQFNNVIPQGGGGGGGATDDFAARLKQLQTEHETETAQANAWYSEAQATLADRRAMEILGAQGHKAKLQEIEIIHQQQIAAINANAQAARLSQTAGLFGALASIAEAGGKKSAKAVATFQAIEGTINAYGAALKALNTPGITLAGRFAAYASVLGAGLKGVSAIRSAGGIGGGGGGGVAVTAQASAPAAPQTRLVVQGIKLTDLITGEMLMNILGKEFGARNVEFTR